MTKIYQCMPIRRCFAKERWARVSGIILAATYVMLADALTKQWAERALDAGQPKRLVGSFFQLRLGHNTGVAFGALAGTGYVTLVVTSALVSGLLVWLIRTGARGVRAYWAVALVLGGGLANIGDRLPDGRVTDFLDFGVGALRWPAFNLADSFIVVGIAILVAVNMHESREAGGKPPAEMS